MKGYSGMKFYQNQYYQGTLTDHQCDTLLRLLDEEKVDTLKHIIRNATVSEIDEIKDAYKNGSVPPVIENRGTLTDAQTLGVAFMYYSRRCLVGDQVGLGKTVESAGLINIIKQDGVKNILFLTEKTIVPQIRDKLIKFTGEYVDMIPSATKPQIEKFMKRHPDGFTCPIVGSHSLLGCAEFLYYLSNHPLGCLIIDEGYIIKNTTHTYYKSANELSKQCDYFYILNATPLETSARDLYNQLKLIDKPFMPTVAEFERAFCIKRPKRYGFGFEVAGYKNCEAFKRAISLRYIARTRDDISAVFADNDTKIIYVPMSSVQKHLESKTSLHQMVADYPTGVDFTVEYTPETTGKLAATVELCKRTNGKVLIYSRFVQCQAGIKEALEKVGKKPVILNGQCSSSERDIIIKDFNVGTYDVVITNLARGIDLQDCDTCILYTLDPNPQNMVQTFGRLTRDIDVVGKTLYFLISEGREKRLFETSSKVRATASMKFTKVGTNLVLEAIANAGNSYQALETDASDMT